MRRNAVATAAGVLMLTVCWGLSPAQAIGDAEDRSPKMVGAGWIGMGNPNDKVHVQVHLPCPADDAPGGERAGLLIHQGASRFTLTALEAASCSNNLHEGSGIGACNGVGGFVIDWRLADGALGGPHVRPDMASVEVRGPGADCALAVAGPLDAGNLRMVAAPAAR